VRTGLLVTLIVVLVAASSASGGDIASIPLGRGPCCVAVVGGTLWVGEHRSGRIAELDPHSGKVLWSMRVADQAIDYGSFVGAYGALWVYGSQGVVSGVIRIDPKTHSITHVAGLPVVNGLVMLGGKLWASTDSGPFVYRIDPASARVEARLKVRGRASYVLGAAADGALWCPLVNSGQTSSGEPNSITVRIDPTGKIVKSLQPFGSGAYGALVGVRSVAAVGNAIWETMEDDSVGPGISATVLRIDAKTGHVTLRMRPKIHGYSSAFPDVMSAGDGTLWLQTGPSTIERIDPTTGKTLRAIAIPLGSKRLATDYWNSAIAGGLGFYWITVWPGTSGPSDTSTGKLIRVPS
jgi:streptogramin lyase